MEYVVEAENLSKYYNSTKAVDNLNLKIKKGEIYGLLGPNGAGKTTTILMFLGLTQPTSGKIKVCGFDPVREALKVKRITGYLPENVGFYEDLTAFENLNYIARLNNIPSDEAERRINEALDSVGLSEVAKFKVGTFSKGMKQRLGIAEVLLKSPQFAIFDEPTSGIDPEGANQILEMIVRMNQEQGITVLLSSHLLHQVQRICHRVGIISKGCLVTEGSMSELKTKTMQKEPFVFELRLGKVTSELLDSIKALDGIVDLEIMGDLIRVRCSNDLRAELARAAVNNNAELMELRSAEYTLEDIYLKYFQQE